MTEGYAKHFGEGMIRVKSAGIEAHGKNPTAIEVMSQDGIDISHQESTRLSTDMLEWADLIVTVCGHADSHCPTLPNAVEKRHWPIDDPAKAEGSEQEVIEKFYQVRDEIKQRVRDLVLEIIDYEDGI